ncbi:aldehyde dehydrogenase [Mycobacterium sp. pW049]|uniref:aldehyde dehydrogenase family protein n=1 Tax=[Mycobacterium] bulgaricum TaxID=3238985 RepID=UPI00351B3B29
MTVQAAPTDGVEPAGLLIGGELVTETTGGTFQHVYAATGAPSLDVPLAGAADIDRAVSAARAAFPAWRATSADQRRNALAAMGRLIGENVDKLSKLNTLDNGTALNIATAQNFMAVDLFAYNAGWADKGGGEVHDTWPIPAFDYSLDEPYGVIGIIIPWNGPVTAIGQTVGPALAAGNCVVLKPPEVAPFSALEMGRLFTEAGFPPGVVNVLPGGAEAGEALVRHPGVDKIHFTGSGATAKKIGHAATDTLKPLGLELGGKSAILVFDDADIASAVQTASGAITLNLAGQGCICGTRAIVHRSVYSDFVAALTTAVEAIPVGDPLDQGTLMGPVANQGHCERIMSTIHAAIDDNHGRLVTGGERIDGDLANGFFIRPTVFADVDNSSPLAREEIFGPVQTVMPFDTDEEAVGLANDSTYGLAGYIHTENLRRAHRTAAALETGMVWVNGGFGIPSSVPFGGVKQSGYGRIGGRKGVEEFTRSKNIWIAL